MSVRSILAEKGRDVVTLEITHTVGEAVALLAKHRIGALVVTAPNGTIRGIVSERDVIRHISEDGVGVLSEKVERIMTANVKVCTENHSVNEVMEMMTRGRFRHLPVERDGKLAGVVSIGDVVKRKIEEAERETEAIKTYIASA